MSYTVAKGNQRLDPDEVKESGMALDGVVDLRSDTVTRPTEEMRRAMGEAQRGVAERGAELEDTLGA